MGLNLVDNWGISCLSSFFQVRWFSSTLKRQIRLIGYSKLSLTMNINGCLAVLALYVYLLLDQSPAMDRWMDVQMDLFIPLHTELFTKNSERTHNTFNKLPINPYKKITNVLYI